MPQTIVSSPVGDLTLDFSQQKLISVKRFQGEHHTATVATDTPCDHPILVWFQAFQQKRFQPIPMDWIDLSNLRDFQRDVLIELSTCPPGCWLTYGQLARKILRPKAARAVGQALHRNPCPTILPCHRVRPASGEMGGFAWGAEAKEQLYQHENLKISD